MSVTAISAPGSTAKKRLLADLERSGLGLADAKKLKLVPLVASQTRALTAFKDFAGHLAQAYKLPYFDVHGNATDFYRLRFLDVVKSSKEKRVVRYWQPPDSMPRAYFPPYVDWSKIVADPTVPLKVTEGEKKAALLTKLGVPTIGLGGVWNWTSKKLRQPLIPDLMTVDWRERSVLIIFDTDPVKDDPESSDLKPEVAGALEKLGHTLELRGAIAQKITLPVITPGQKTGLDDFLVHHGAGEAAVAALRALPHDDLQLTPSFSLLNEELAAIDSPPGFYHLPTGYLFKTLKHAAETVYVSLIVQKVNPGGSVVDVNAAVEWGRWPRHRRHSTVVYEPGLKPVVTLPERGIDNALNVWPGFPHPPKPGPVDPFLELLEYQFDEDSEALRWFLRWLAYPLQYPGTKLFTAVVLCSKGTGTGKTLLGQTIGRIYGENFATITEAQLHSPFNEWHVNKQFVLGEEVSGSDQRMQADALKHLITGESITINRKHQPTYSVRDCCNFLFTTNHTADAFLLDSTDRRFFVHEIVKPPPPQKFFDAYDPWYKTPAAIAAVFAHLLEVDLGGFNPRARVPITDAHRAMAGNSGNDHDFFVRDLLAAPGARLKIGDAPVARDLFTLTEIIELVDSERRWGLKPMSLARAFGRAGVKPLVTSPPGEGTVKLYPVRDLARWTASTHEERAAHYRPPPAPEKPQKF